jgi:hypothetical protein
MGPYHPQNLCTCCGMCNLMKGYRSMRGFVEAARHIATHRGGRGDFGRYPHRFRNNTSRRSRSAYITQSSTHTKTHALTNEAFARIVARPCRYCGKQSDPPRHHNGLDRVNNDTRVYTEDSCDSCCGDCNVMKYTHSEADFIEHCCRVAHHNVGVDTFVGDEADCEGVCEGEDVGGDHLVESLRCYPQENLGNLSAMNGPIVGGNSADGVDDDTKDPAVLAWDTWTDPDAADEEQSESNLQMEHSDGQEGEHEDGIGLRRAVPARNPHGYELCSDANCKAAEADDPFAGFRFGGDTS